MDLQGAFLARLKANPTLSGLTGGRITWGGRPEKAALPAIVLTKAAPGRDWSHDGADPLERPLVQLDIYGALLRDAGPVVAAVQDEMQRLDDVTAGGWLFQAPGTLENDQWPGTEDLPGGGQAYRVSQDYRFWARPA